MAVSLEIWVFLVLGLIFGFVIGALIGQSSGEQKVYDYLTAKRRSRK